MKYYEAEQQRLLLMSKSASMKAEELARRADEKSRQLGDMQRKLGMTASRGASPTKSMNGDMSRANFDHLETQSEFSVMTNESDIKTDENVMDFVVQDAEFFYDAFR